MAAWLKGGLPGREHLAQYARQKDISFEEAAARFGYDKLEPPEGFEFVWEWFFELSRTRTGNSFGWNAISWSEMRAWAEISGVRLEPWLAQCFQAMDQEWLQAAAGKGKKNGGANRT